jgi:hypothetical protein
MKTQQVPESARIVFIITKKPLLAVRYQLADKQVSDSNSTNYSIFTHTYPRRSVGSNSTSCPRMALTQPYGTLWNVGCLCKIEVGPLNRMGKDKVHCITWSLRNHSASRCPLS